MPTLRCTGLLLLLSACAGDAAATALQPSAAMVSSSLELHVGSGFIRGFAADNGVRSFLGVPYAQPPLGALRWQAPVTQPAWDGFREATRWSARCPQAASHGQASAIESEDCLYLNVWAPSTASALPVMVWIHGGGNVDGTASDEALNGKLLAARFDVVVVSLNYRLGVLGFLSHPALAADGGGLLANQGLRDQQLALRWVRDNIAVFGGDPDNVTIFGESAGASDVCLHMVAPGSKGLFARALGESGGCTTRRKPVSDAAAQGVLLAQQLGCGDGDPLACMRGKSVQEVFAAADALGAGVSFGPVVDGAVTPDQPRALYDAGALAHVPYLIGSNTDEGTGFTLDATGISDDAGYLAALRARLLVPEEQVAALYPASNFRDHPDPYQAAIARAWGDRSLVCSSLDVAQRTAAAGLPVFMYNFDMPLDGKAGVWGAAHATEIVFVFGTKPDFTPEERAVSDRMQRYWTQFAKTGDPNAAELEAWPRFTTAQDVRLNFGVATTQLHDFRGRECAFWREQYERAFQ
jgi:para-nitrobenzyl esterase